VQYLPMACIIHDCDREMLNPSRHQTPLSPTLRNRRHTTEHGLRNHRYEQVVDLFRWIAAELPDSDGLLYVHDDEDCGRDSDFSNEFRVWRMARGRFDESADTHSSPYFPTVELPETFDEPAEHRVAAATDNRNALFARTAQSCSTGRDKRSSL
jgi:hypothetical protein